MSQKDKMKLVAAIVILALAGLVFAWQYGLFEGSPKKPSVSPPTGTQQPPSGTPTGGPRQAPTG
jgi:hypothetical protein